MEYSELQLRREALVPRGGDGDVLVVADIMSWPVLKVDPETPAGAAQSRADSLGVNHLVVAYGDQVVGALCVCDLWWARPKSQAQHLMAPSPVTIDAGDFLQTAASAMHSNNVSFLPVVKNDRLCGVVTRGDLRRAAALDPCEANPCCIGCGGHHHLHALTGSGFKLCLRCLGSKDPCDLEQLLDEPTWLRLLAL